MNTWELTSHKFEYVEYFFIIDVVTVIFSILRINFAKIYMDSKVVLSITLLFDRMLSFVKRDFTKCHKPHNFTIL